MEMRKTFFAVLFSVLMVGSAGAWTTPANVGAGINTAASEDDPSVNATNTTLYFDSNRAGGFGGWDIYQSIYSGGSWQPASNIGGIINSSNLEAEPAWYQSTYPEIYFSSDRSGGQGSTDIWMSWYQSGAWSTPSNLGSTVNTANGEGEPFPVSIGGSSRVFFCSNRPGGYGGYDIYMTTYSSGWLTPANIGAGINTSSYEYGVCVTADGLTMYFASDRAGGYGGYDLYKATYSGGAWGNAQNLGSVVNTSYSESHPGVSADGLNLYFGSNRPGGFGNTDIYVTQNNSDVTPSSLGRVKAAFR